MNNPLSIREFESRYLEGKDAGAAKYCVPNFSKDSIRVEIKGGKEYSGTNFTNVCKSIATGERVEEPPGLGNGNQANAGHFIEFFKDVFGEESMDESYISANINIQSDEPQELDEHDAKFLENVVEEKVFKGLEGYANVIVEGVAGSGKSHLLGSLRRAFYKQEGSEVTYWVAPEKSKKDSEKDIKDKEREVENKRNEGFFPLYGENGSRIEVVVFHPSTSYEEFVSGIRPNFMKNEKNQDDFVTQEGIFIEQCNRAASNPDKKFLLFIDEINRANTSRVFGDLMLVIEDSKRVDFSKISETLNSNTQDGSGEISAEIIDLSAGQGKDEGEESKKGYRYGALFSAPATVPSDEDNKPTEYVRLQTPIVKNGIEFNKLAVPTNLHVLGTMNTTDRSVGTIDLALRRRFHWIIQEPMSDRKELLKALNLSEDKKESVGSVAGWYLDANATLLKEVGPDARLGHAYFFGKDGDAEAIAEALITQLLEIIFTFNIKKDVLEEIGLPPVSKYVGKKLDYEGQGLGRRPVVKKPEDKGKSSMTDRGNNSKNEGAEGAVAEPDQGNQ